jgi:hypothetical protein
MKLPICINQCAVLGSCDINFMSAPIMKLVVLLKIRKYLFFLWIGRSGGSNRHPYP